MTVMIVLRAGAIVEMEIPGFRSAVSLLEQMRRSLSLRGIQATAEMRSDCVIVRER